MVSAEFEILEEKIILALNVIKDLKGKNDSLANELKGIKDSSDNLNQQLSAKNEEIARLQSELEDKTNNMVLAGEKVQSLIEKLNEEHLEEVLQ